MKILFVTMAYPRGSEQHLQDLNNGIPLSISANTFQWAVIEGLYLNHANFEVVSQPSLCCFPHNFKKLFSPQMDMEIGGKKIGVMLKTLRLKFFTGWYHSRQLKKYIRNWAKSNNNEDKLVLLIYSTESITMRILPSIKKEFRNLIVCPIVTDLVDDMLDPVFDRSYWFQLKSKNEIRKVKQLYSVCDRFILLTKGMEEKIPEARGKNIVIEGIALNKEYVFVPKNELITRSLLYTGDLGSQTSIKDLVDAFMLTSNPKYRLIICGSGEFENYIKQKSQQDNRIVFKGFVSRDEAVRLQRETTAVINPRKPSISLTKYSFPSKTMEYLSSGTPMIGYKLEGIPEDYYKYMYVVDGLELQDLANTISEVLERPQEELNKKAKEAMDFIANNKTTSIQGERILEFLS